MIVHFLISIFLFFSLSNNCLALSDEQVSSLQNELKDKSVGDRIAFFAEGFVGTPYDPDPLGAYVTKAVIVTDEKVDCMYLTFRAVELALSSTPGEAAEMALDKRFHSKGVVANGKVVNYDDRFAYGEDMITSGKWGKDITAELGKTAAIKSPRTGESYYMLPNREILGGMSKLSNGDIVFFMKTPAAAVSNEIVGHIGIIKINAGTIYLIHASGRKGKGGLVRETALRDYIRKMPFIGVIVTRFPD